MATEILLDHSSPLQKQWSPLRQASMEDGETSTKFQAWCVSFLVEVVVINLLLEGLDMFNQSSCMIYPSVGGICQWRCSMKSMKGSIITLLDWEVWRHPHRCRKNILKLFYNLVDWILLDIKVLVWGCNGCNVLPFTFWSDFEEAKLCSMRDYFVALFWWENSQNYL